MFALRTATLSLLLASALLAGCGGKFDDNSQVLATVNGEDITQKDFDHYVQARQRQMPMGDLTAEQRRVVLDELIDRVVLAQYGESLGLDLTEEVHFGVKRQRENLIAREFVLDTMRKEYDKKVADINKTEYKVRHILLETEKEADQLAKRIKGGADFEKTAKAKSVDTISGKEGGDIGWVSQISGLAPEFIDGVVKLQPGEVSDPVKTEFGWHLIKVEETRPLEIPSFKDALGNPRMQDFLRQLQQENMQKLQTTLAELKDKAKIDVKDAAEAQ